MEIQRRGRAVSVCLGGRGAARLRGAPSPLSRCPHPIPAPFPRRRSSSCPALPVGVVGTAPSLPTKLSWASPGCHRGTGHRDGSLCCHTRSGRRWGDCAGEGRGAVLQRQEHCHSETAARSGSGKETRSQENCRQNGSHRTRAENRLSRRPGCGAGRPVSRPQPLGG